MINIQLIQQKMPTLALLNSLPWII